MRSRFAGRYGGTRTDITEAVVANHVHRQRNPGSAFWRVSARGMTVVYEWPDDAFWAVSHYDRDADIVWLALAGFEGARVGVQEANWGLVETDSETGAVVALEFWKASTVLPAELLEALPTSAARPVVIEAQHAGPDSTLAGPPVD